MHQLRYKLVILRCLFPLLIRLPKLNNYRHHPEKFSDEQCYSLALSVMDYVRIKAKTTTQVYGTENLPKSGGYILYSNHQGKYDALGILLSHPKTCSVLWERNAASRILARHINGLLKGQTIDFENKKEFIDILKKIVDEVKGGKRYLIFPEGGYKDNKNNLQNFKSGCFMCSILSKAPIIPVAIYDSFKAMNTSLKGKVETQVHFLKPILYNEFKSLSRRELSEIVKSRIQEKLNEIEENMEMPELQ